MGTFSHGRTQLSVTLQEITVIPPAHDPSYPCALRPPCCPFNSHLQWHRPGLFQIHFTEVFVKEIPTKPLLIILRKDLAQIKGQESAV